METVGKTRKWGNSLGIVLPKEFVKEENIEEGDEVVIKKKKKPSLSDLRGILVGVGKTAQELKNEGREGWHDKTR